MLLYEKSGLEAASAIAFSSSTARTGFAVPFSCRLAEVRGALSIDGGVEVRELSRFTTSSACIGGIDDRETFRGAGIGERGGFSTAGSVDVRMLENDMMSAVRGF